MKFATALFLGALSVTMVFGGAAFADGAPQCLDRSGDPIPVNDSQVLNWESTTPNQYLARAHVSGTIVEIYPDHSGHNHFAIQIGPNTSDRLEVIYNQDFGTVPSPSVGDQVEACGDYITSTEQAGPYPPSPCGAIIHWVHQSDNPQRHPDGFLMINGQVFGYLHGNGSDQVSVENNVDNGGENNSYQPYCSRRRHRRHKC